jgi:hypothetical protein
MKTMGIRAVAALAATAAWLASLVTMMSTPWRTSSRAASGSSAGSPCVKRTPITKCSFSR